MSRAGLRTVPAVGTPARSPPVLEPLEGSNAKDTADAADPLSPDNARCPRCGAGFHCGVNGAMPCACSSVTLSAAQLAGLRQRYGRCLCLACLTGLPALP